MKIGFLGGGQLAQMMALAGYPLGLEFRCLATTSEEPATRLMPFELGSTSDMTTLSRFARGLDIVTLETENTDLNTIESLIQLGMRVMPGPTALALTQDRLFEKQLFQRLGIPSAHFRQVDQESELAAAMDTQPGLKVLKTRRNGYDGKGQIRLSTVAEAAAAYRALGPAPLLLEDWVPMQAEGSILCVRSSSGETAFYPITQNVHISGILHKTAPWPRADAAALQAQAETYGRSILGALDYVGVLCLEFFVVDGRMVANEIAPRVHNSGHWTIEAAATSQFENHLRAILGWPLGPTTMREDFVMFNLLSTMPDRDALLKIPQLALHAYGKAPRPGRKLGHITVCGAGLEHLTSLASLVTG